MPDRGRLQQAFDAMRGQRAVLVGDLILDAYVYGETVRVSREAPVLVVRKERIEHRLGGAANTAVNLAALGVVTHVVGTVGRDEDGSRLRAMLEAAGVEVEAVREVDRPTPVKTRVLAGAFGTSRQQVLRIDDEPQGELSASAEHELTADVRRLGRDAGVVAVSDYGLGSVGQGTLGAVRDLAKAGRRVCVDSRYGFREFHGVTVITPNVPEAEALVGYSLASPDAVARAGREILESLGLDACLVTQGRAGMTLFQRGRPPAHVDIVGEDEVADVTGAGDTVAAVFAAALAAGIGMENAMRLANCAAGVVVTRVGTAAATPEEIVEAALRGGVELLPWDA